VYLDFKALLQYRQSGVLVLTLAPWANAKQQLEIIHQHLRNIDCLTVHTACLVCLIGSVNGCSKKRKKRSLLRAALVAGT
jgi:hypothetical protein